MPDSFRRSANSGKNIIYGNIIHNPFGFLGLGFGHLEFRSVKILSSKGILF